MADPQLSHPGEITWFAGHGPKTPLGLRCDHSCDHNFSASVIAWGPDFEHYSIVECRICGCRSWTVEYPSPFTAERPKYRVRGYVQMGSTTTDVQSTLNALAASSVGNAGSRPTTDA